MAGFADPRTIAGTERDAEAPHLAVSGRHVHVVWHEKPDAVSENHEVWFAHSGNRGGRFDDKVDVSASPGTSSEQEALAVDDDAVHVVWLELDLDDPNAVPALGYRRGRDHGDEWEAPVPLVTGMPGTDRPRVAVAGDDVWVAWLAQGPAALDVFVAHSDNGGEWFESGVNVSEGLDDAADHEIAVADGRAVVVWRRQTAAAGVEVFYARSS